MQLNSLKHSQAGVAMIEILITIFVMAFGFLAVLLLQMKTMENVAGANQRYVAANFAQDMGERLRANSDYMADYVTPDWNTIGTDCTNNAVCKADFEDWQAAMASSAHDLPNAKGKITTINTQFTMRVEIQWSEKDLVESFILDVPINDKNI